MSRPLSKSSNTLDVEGPGHRGGPDLHQVARDTGAKPPRSYIAISFGFFNNFRSFQYFSMKFYVDFTRYMIKHHVKFVVNILWRKLYLTGRDAESASFLINEGHTMQ